MFDTLQCDDKIEVRRFAASYIYFIVNIYLYHIHFWVNLLASIPADSSLLMPEEILNRKAPTADRRIWYGPDAQQFMDLRLPRFGKEHGLVMMLHGGFWREKYDLLHTGHMCAALTSVGIVTANLEYRRSGNGGGGWPNTLEDIRAAYRFLREHAQQFGFDPQRMVVAGHSAGGHLALCLAAYDGTVTNVVSLAGVLDLQRAYRLHLSHDAVVDFLHGSPAEVPENYRDADTMQLAIPQARQWILHGSGDEVVPADFSKEYVRSKKARGEDVQLAEITDADHFDLIDPGSGAWEHVERVIAKALSME